jgi:hypothetical protein
MVFVTVEEFPCFRVAIAAANKAKGVRGRE